MCVPSLTASQVLSITYESGVEFQMENNVPSPGFPFLYHANFDDFSKLFCRERERNVYSFERHVLSYRSAH